MLTFAFCWMLGEVAWLANGVVRTDMAAMPSLTDLGFMSGCPFAVAALISLHANAAGRSRFTIARALDGFIIVACVAFISWALALQSIVEQATGSWQTIATVLAYPLSDIAFVSAAVMLWLQSSRSSRRTPTLLGFALIAISVADTTWASLMVAGDSAVGHLADAPPRHDTEVAAPRRWSCVVRVVLDGVVRVVQRFTEKSPDMDVVGSIKDSTPVAAMSHESSQAEFGQVLGHRRSEAPAGQAVSAISQPSERLLGRAPARPSGMDCARAPKDRLRRKKDHGVAQVVAGVSRIRKAEM